MSLSTSTRTATSTVPRWIGACLVAAAAVNVVVEAVVAHAWDARPYSYTDDYVNFLGSPFAGDFQGITISSPQWWLMSTAWILTGVLIAAAGVSLGRRTTGWRRTTLSALGLAQGIALVLFAVFPLGPTTLANGTLPLYLLGAFLSIIAGNALAVVTGIAGRTHGLPRWLAILSIALGAIGLINIPATYGSIPTGLAERISVYSYLTWALLTGVTILRGTRRTAR